MSDDLEFDIDTTIDLGNGYGVSDNTITLDPSLWNAGGGAYTISTTGTGDYEYSGVNWGNISDNKGITIAEDGDLTIGNRSLKEFMDKVEERLAILNVNQELEAQWEELKALGDKYRELEKTLLERNKIMDILKDKG